MEVCIKIYKILKFLFYKDIIYECITFQFEWIFIVLATMLMKWSNIFFIFVNSVLKLSHSWQRKWRFSCSTSVTNNLKRFMTIHSWIKCFYLFWFYFKFAVLYSYKTIMKNSKFNWLISKERSWIKIGL